MSTANKSTIKYIRTSDWCACIQSARNGIVCSILINHVDCIGRTLVRSRDNTHTHLHRFRVCLLSLPARCQRNKLWLQFHLDMHLVPESTQNTHAKLLGEYGIYAANLFRFAGLQINQWKRNMNRMMNALRDNKTEHKHEKNRYVATDRLKPYGKMLNYGCNFIYK